MSEWDGEVAPSEHKLNDKQVCRLLAMTKALRETAYLNDYVHQIKGLLADGNVEDARGLWSDLDESEQIALWVAPTFGGVFTTAEREALHYDKERQ